MTTLWQRQALNPSSFETLWLLDVAFHLKAVAYLDTELRAQLTEAWAWCFKTGNEPSWALRPSSSAYAASFSSEQARGESASPETLPDLEGAP